MAVLEHRLDRGVRLVDQLHVLRQACEAHIESNRKEIAGQREFRIRAFDPIRVEAMNGNDRGVGLAAFETRKKLAAPRRRVPSLVRNLRGYGPPTLRDRSKCGCSLLTPFATRAGGGR